MTHDWLKQIEDMVAEKFRDGSVEAPMVIPTQPGIGKPFSELRLEHEFDVTAETIGRWQTLIGAMLEQRRREENALLTRATIAARELGQGVFVLHQDGQVVSAEPSRYVPAGQAYVANDGVLHVLRDRAESGPPQWSPIDPIID